MIIEGLGSEVSERGTHDRDEGRARERREGEEKKYRLTALRQHGRDHQRSEDKARKATAKEATHQLCLGSDQKEAEKQDSETERVAHLRSEAVQERGRTNERTERETAQSVKSWANKEKNHRGTRKKRDKRETRKRDRERDESSRRSRRKRRGERSRQRMH